MACQAGTLARVSRPTLELADLFRKYADQLGPLSSQQQHVARAITKCRTAAMGGHVRTCEQCGHEEISYNSCRNRHCPKCGALAQARWIQARKADLLPVQYFHVVFTVPHILNSLFLSHPRLAINQLFAAVAETLQEVALGPKHLGARIGVTAVLHTWTQLLLYHPHIHCIVPGGGLDPTGTTWVQARSGFFLPVRILSKVFRGKLLSKLQKALDPELRGSLLQQAAQTDWVVYCKPPFAGPEQVLGYLGRYTHRIAISNQRLVSLQDDQLTFGWKDRAHENEPKLMTLDAVQFLKRFLLHVLPQGLVRIRHYGLLANPVRRQRIAQCRELLKKRSAGALAEPAPEPTPAEAKTWEELLLQLTGKDVRVCSRCGKGEMLITQRLAPEAHPIEAKGLSP